jgi:soluble lytic murein transglycosylase
MKRTLKITFCILFLWLLAARVNDGAPLPQKEFENLCRQFQQKPSLQTRAALLNFCASKKQNPVFALGYFLAGINDYQEKKYDSASALLEKIPLKDSSLPDYVLYHHAAALSHLGKNQQALEKARQILDQFPFSPFWEKTRILYWENCLQTQQVELILASMKTEKNALDSPSLLYFHARALDETGQAIQAWPLYQKIYYLFPLSEEAEKAERQMGSLSARVNSLPPPPDDYLLSRAELLLAGNGISEAHAYLLSLQHKTAIWERYPQLQVWLGLTFLKKGNDREAYTWLKQNAEQENAASAEALCHLAGLYQKQDQPEESKKCIQLLEQRWSQSPWLEKALFSLGNYYLVHFNRPEAMAAYQKLIRFFSNGKYTREAHWRVGWNYYREQDYAHAAELFLTFLDRFPDGDMSAAALYWLARSWQNQNHPEWASTVLPIVVKRYAHSYYGQLAAQQLSLKKGLPPVPGLPNAATAQLLGRYNHPVASPSPKVLVKPTSAALAQWPRADVLQLLQLKEWAARELLTNKGYENSPVIIWQAASLYCQAGLYRKGIQLIKQLIPAYLELPMKSLPEWFWLMVFPADYLEIIKEECRLKKLDPHLILALIMQESSFDPKAISRSNAYGLMQLLPSTARPLARKMRISKRLKTTQLFDPSLNIKMGTTYFVGLLAESHGEVEMALASYNAGSNRTRAWEADGSFTEGVEFIESIPFSETRSYIKIILRDRWFYEQLFPLLK